MTLVLVYVTAANEEEAMALGREAVAQRLAACANVLGDITSIYRWQGEVAVDSEVSLILKTREDLVGALVDQITARHSYDCPCVVAIRIVDGNPDFLEWITNETVPAA